MAILTNTFAGGADGVNISTTNSGGASGDPFNVIVINGASAPSGGPEIQYEVDAGVGGALGARLTPSAVQTYIRWDVDTPAARYVARIEIRYEGVPDSPMNLVSINAGGTFLTSAVIDSEGRVMANNGITNIIDSRSSTGLFTPGNTYAFEVAITPHASNATIALRVTDASNTIIYSWSEGGLATDLGPVTQYRFGNFDINDGWTRLDIQAVRGGDLASGWIGPVLNALPSPEVTVQSVSPPTTLAGSNGSITVAWPAVTGADHYEAAIRTGFVETGFTASDADATSPHTFTGLSAGEYTVAVRAMAS